MHLHLLETIKFLIHSFDRLSSLLFSLSLSTSTISDLGQELAFNLLMFILLLIQFFLFLCFHVVYFVQLVV